MTFRVNQIQQMHGKRGGGAVPASYAMNFRR